MTIWLDNLDAIYRSEIGAAATLTPGAGGSFAGPLDVTVIDKTTGIELQDQNGLNTIRPAAYIRMSEMESNSLTRIDLDGGTLVINGKTWRIHSHMLKPNPDGELKGEAVMILSDESV